MNRITVEQLEKSYRIGRRTDESVLAQTLRTFSGRESKTHLPVLRGVTFAVDAGEVVGVIGKNGSGKSTLLRILAGILKQDGGHVTTNGKVVPLIQLGDGMKDRLTLEENVILMCTLLGFSQHKIRTEYSHIIRYAELDAFTHTKWYQFSLGMKQRAVFSIIMHADPDVLLLDEVFSAGDEVFRIKSLADMLSFARRGSSILLVGHELKTLEQSCDRVIWIDNGVVKRDGGTREVIAEYRTYHG